MILRNALLQRIQNQTKPPGSLGQLEEIGLRLGLLQSSLNPSIRKPGVSVFAASHGIANEGVSAYPSAVTGEMVGNFLRGGAAVCVLARSVGASLRIVDVGVDAPTEVPWRTFPGLHGRPIARGTASFLRGPAMQPAQCTAALEMGADEVHAALREETDVLALGEMGIGNTTSAAALCAALLEVNPIAVTGRGTGVDEAGLRHKQTVIADSLAMHRLQAPPPAGNPAATARFWLEHVGGFEIAALTGCILAAHEARLPVVIDGFIVSTAALVASRINPECLDVCFFAHRSAESGHGLVLEELQATPLLSLGMRLGEGSGAVLALPLMQAAARLVSEMASFASAGISTALATEDRAPLPA
jgi:nicotinate-nucleotide--dimethylbenzimidazole phosphoribosyltransferase